MQSLKKSTLVLMAVVLVSCGRQTSQSQLLNGVDSLCKKWVPVASESICSATISVSPDKSIVVKGETTMPEAKSDIIQYIEKSGKKCIDSLNVLPDASVGDKGWGIVSLSVINIRERRSQAAEMITQALLGTPVKILKNSGSWYLVQTPDMYIGWAEDESVYLVTEKELAGWKGSERIIYTAKWGDINDMSNKGIISDIVFGSVLQVTGMNSNRYEVIMPNGKKGTVSKSDAVDFRQWAERKDYNPEEIAKFGCSFLGYPYLWGGISHKGVDCSGLARACYFSAGIIITRDASSQFLYGQPVDVSASIDNLKTGDLLFFGSSPENITHVGMYIGNTEFVHSSGFVKINSLDSARENYSKYLRGRLQGARRFLGVPSDKGSVRVKEHNWYF